MRPQKGFTLLELVVVIVILGILATLGFTQYTKIVERGRTAEARTILATIRKAEIAYYLERGAYATAFTDLSYEAPTSCGSSQYFSYAVDGTTATATRCTSAGKTPNASSVYTITLTHAGVFGGTAGYY